MKEKKALIVIIFILFIITLSQAEDLLIKVPSPDAKIKNWLNRRKLGNRITHDRECLEIIANAEILEYLTDNQRNY